MEKLGLLFLSVLFFCGFASATNSNGVLYPFEINDQLVCNQGNPDANLPGEPPHIPSPIQRVPYGLPKEGEGFTQIWLPQTSGFRIPSRKGLDEDALLNFLGDDYNRQLTSVNPPAADSVPPRACDLLPAVEGSGGQQLRHPEFAQEPIPLLATNDTENGGERTVIWDQIVNLDPNSRIREELRVRDFRNTEFSLVWDVVDETNAQDALCDIWIAKCPLTPQWVELPDGYFPYYLAQSTCNNKNCSFPRGLTCQEDFSYQVYVTVLRWDCCFNTIRSETRWDCGWTKVQIPIFCDCTCGCNEVPPHT